MDPSLAIHCLHLADSNRPTGIIAQIIAAAEKRAGCRPLPRPSGPVAHLEKWAPGSGRCTRRDLPGLSVARGVFGATAKTTHLAGNRRRHQSAKCGHDYSIRRRRGYRRLLYPKRGIASLGPLVIKASAGNVFRAPIIRCDTTTSAVSTLKTQGYRVAVLQASAPQSLFDYQPEASMVCVLGGESEGVGADVLAMADTELSVPMANGVESLNVAVTASLAAFHLGRPPG